MKYIRTKDKIEKVPNDYANKLVKCPNLTITDTIEELCDEFVVNKKVVYGLTQINKWVSVNKMKPPYLKEIYGAIWTDKGLIYVAKMNEKGELELL